MTDLSPEHLSGFTLDAVIVRELRFVDNLHASRIVRLKDVEVNFEVSSNIAADKTRCSVRLRATIKPPKESDEFQIVAAAVEGHFKVAGDGQTVGMTEFASRQAPAILMPFLRSEIAQLTSRSRFGQLLLPPINVVALVEQIEKERKELPSDKSKID